MRCIEPWHFGWPWVTFEGHFGDLFIVATLCAQLMRNLLAIAKFLVLTGYRQQVLGGIGILRCSVPIFKSCRCNARCISNNWAFNYSLYLSITISSVRNRNHAEKCSIQTAVMSAASARDMIFTCKCYAHNSVQQNCTSIHVMSHLTVCCHSVSVSSCIGTQISCKLNPLLLKLTAIWYSWQLGTTVGPLQERIICHCIRLFRQ